MSDELSPGPSAPQKPSAQMHDAALKAFEAHAQQAHAPMGRARSVWRRRIEPWVVAAAVLIFIAWALLHVLS